MTEDNDIRWAYVDYIGCEKRKLDAQKLLDYFKANGISIVSNPEKADIIIYITCAFIKEFENLSVKNIKDLYQKKMEGTQIIIGGCLPAINPEVLTKFKNAILIPVRETNQIDEYINPKIRLNEICEPNKTIFENRKHRGKPINIHYTKTRKDYEAAKKGYKIRLSYGCMGNCTYCVTKYATKSLKSEPVHKILAAFKKAVEIEEKTLFLTGGDSGAYGKDIGTNIVELLKKLLEIQGNYKFFFHDFGVQWLIKYEDTLIPLFKNHRENLGVFNFPIQSGSNKILKLMRRPYKIEKVIKVLNQLKHEVPQLQFGTHLIVGFPGENYKEFSKTMYLLDKIPFDFIMIFKYSDNPLAESSKLSDKIPEKEKDLRYSKLLEKYLDNHFKRNKKD